RARLYDVPAPHRAKLHSTSPIERLNGEVKRRTDVVGIFPNEDAIVRLVGAILLEQNDEWAVQRARYVVFHPRRSDCSAGAIRRRRQCGAAWCARKPRMPGRLREQAHIIMTFPFERHSSFFR